MNNISLSYTPEECYALGFIWADGCLTNNNNIRIEIIQSDADNISDIFTKSSLSMHKKNIQRRGRHPQTLFYKGSKTLANYLTGHNYREKFRATTILKDIPINFQNYWWRGFSDGDGCFYAGDSHCQFSITGPYEQDWSFVEELFQTKNISYHISRIVNKYGKKSYVKTGKSGGKLFGEYIYQGFLQDNIGLTRKHNKYLQFLL